MSFYIESAIQCRSMPPETPSQCPAIAARTQVPFEKQNPFDEKFAEEEVINVGRGLSPEPFKQRIQRFLDALPEPERTKLKKIME